MSADGVARDVSQVTDFHFHTCRKFRLFSAKAGSSSNSSIVRNRLVTSSQLGVTFGIVSANQLTCFPTKSLLGFKLTRENMNVEVTDFPVKSIDLFGVDIVNDMGINSDGTLLAVLHTRNNDVSVDVFDVKTLCSSSNSAPFKPLCTTRIGTDQTNEGSCLEWNPAFPDTFAAASTDRSIMVAKINPQDPSNQKLVGIGKLGAVTTAISWSPKGKQLTIGDSLGKIVQLKPELDVVRSQFGPGSTPSHGKVTGLCWLATTEWLVSFEKGTDHEAYLMRCKKDKPTEWVQYHELSYSSSKWSLPPQLFPATALLVDWNVVIVGNSKTSEIATVGKRDDWQTWVPVEGESIYLPTNSNGKDTVPVGVAIDLSMTEEVSLKPDGTQKHRPSPLVLCLTNDGILTVHHVISTFSAHKSCQIASQNIAVTGLSKLQFDSGDSQHITGASSSFSSSQVPIAKPSTIFEQKPQSDSEVANPKGVSSTFAMPKPASTMVGAISTPAVSTQGTGKSPIPAVSTPQPKPLVVSTPVTTESTAPEEVRTPEDKTAEQLAMKKKILIDRVNKMNNSMASAKESIMKMSFAAGKVKSSVLECAEVIKESLGDSKEVMDELKNLIFSIERMSDRTQHTVKEMDFEIDEKMELVAGVEDGETVLEKLRSMSETEKLMRFNKLETSADLLNGKFEECCDKIKKLRNNLAEKESLRKQAVLSPLRANLNLSQLRSGAETEVALKVMRNVFKIIIDTRERIQRTELEFVRFHRELSNETYKKGANRTVQQPLEMSILEGDAPLRAKMTDAEIVKARQALVARIQKRGPVKTRNVMVESYKTTSVLRTKKDDLIDTSNLSNAILKLSMTPRRVMPTSSFFSSADTPSSTKADAATQADEPPVVKTVVVTVDSPVKPVASAPIVSTPVSKPVATTSTTTIATPKVNVKKEEVKQEQTSSAEQKPYTPSAPSSSIFSGSLFGSKTPQTSTTTSGTSPLGKSSIFGTSLNISPPNAEKSDTPSDLETEQTTPKVIEELKEKPKVNEEAKDVVTEKPKIVPEEQLKVEDKTVKPEPPETTAAIPQLPIQEEKKDEPVTPKSASFSFNTTTTPKSASSTPSIFGGGLKSQTPSSANSSSIFGGSTNNTPIAATNTSSIFGGGAKSNNSPFGNFGQASAQTTPAQNTTTSSASSVSFSFNTGSTTAPPTKPGFGAFGAGAAAKPSSVFGGAVTAPSVPNVDDGMEDDSGISGGGPGGFMSGLGNAGSSNNAAGNNPFAPKPATGSTSNSSWLFGGGAKPLQEPQQQQKPSFSFNAGSNQPTAASATSTSSVFGGAPKFGSQPVFGAKPFGGGAAPAASGLSKNSSIFGGAATSPPSAPAGGGFAQFATGQKTSSLFGGGAAPAQPASSSIFGGGAQAAAAPSSSIFGGGATSNANKPSSFTSWR